MTCSKLAKLNDSEISNIDCDFIIFSRERVEMLDGIGFSWDIRQDAWNMNYAKLCEFVEKNKRLPRNLEDKSFAVWIGAQKRLKRENKLSEMNESLLRKVGVYFEENYSDETWNNRYQELKEYVNIHQCLPQKNNSLYSWIMDQKTR